MDVEKRLADDRSRDLRRLKRCQRTPAYISVYARVCVCMIFTRLPAFACARAHNQPLCTCTCKRPVEAVLVSATTARGPRFEVHRIIKRLRGSDTRLRVLRRPRWDPLPTRNPPFAPTFRPIFHPPPSRSSWKTRIFLFFFFFFSFVSFRAKDNSRSRLLEKERIIFTKRKRKKRESYRKDK